MINKITVYLLFLLLSFQGFCQETEYEMYLDKEMREVDYLQYRILCLNKAFKCLKYNTDSIIVNTVLPKHKFGQLTTDEYKQIRSVLELDSKTKIHPNSNIVISYSDSLFNIETKIKNKIAPFKSTSENIKYHYGSNGFSYTIFPDNEKATKKSIDNFDKKSQKYLKKCIQKYEKQNLASVHLIYNNMQDGFSNLANLVRIKDRGIFKNTFFKIYHNYRLLIIKPDGEYFLNGGFFTNKNFSLLVKNDDWTEFKQELQKLENTSSYINNTFFNEPNIKYKQNHNCF